jgi:hypothetical protein
MNCPHCIIEINPEFQQKYLRADKEGSWFASFMICHNPKCKKIIIELLSGDPLLNVNRQPIGLSKISTRRTVRPITSSRSPVPEEVDLKFANDYNEACLILTLSPKTSAAST